jgi:hypothetical protein
VAQNSKRKLRYTIHIDPHPGYRSAVSYPAGQIVVGGGTLALMQHEDELAVVLGREIAHMNLHQCAARLSNVMRKDHFTADQFDNLPVDEFGDPYGKKGKLERVKTRKTPSPDFSPEVGQIG